MWPWLSYSKVGVPTDYPLGALVCVFLVGGVAAVSSVVRLYALYLYNTSKDIPYDTIFVRNRLDISKYYSLTIAKILLLSQIEIKLGIISASAPSIQSLFHKTSPSRSKASGSDHVDTIGSAPSRSRRHTDTELRMMDGYSATTRRKSGAGATMGSSSEESILREVGITKTMEMTVEFDELHGTRSRRERYG
jgi:hypothetical protein